MCFLIKRNALTLRVERVGGNKKYLATLRLINGIKCNCPFFQFYPMSFPFSFNCREYEMFCLYTWGRPPRPDCLTLKGNQYRDNIPGSYVEAPTSLCARNLNLSNAQSFQSFTCMWNKIIEYPFCLSFIAHRVHFDGDRTHVLTAQS